MRFTKELLESYNFSDIEKKFIEESNTAVTSEMNESRIASEFILGKVIDAATDRVINSNGELAKSNEKHSRSMILLTGGLVLVAVVQIIVQVIQIFIK